MRMNNVKRGKDFTGLQGYNLLPGEDTVTDQQVGKCKYCGEKVAWLSSSKGKKIPCKCIGPPVPPEPDHY